MSFTLAKKWSNLFKNPFLNSISHTTGHINYLKIIKNDTHIVAISFDYLKKRIESKDRETSQRLWVAPFSCGSRDHVTLVTHSTIKREQSMVIIQTISLPNRP